MPIFAEILWCDVLQVAIVLAFYWFSSEQAPTMLLGHFFFRFKQKSVVPPEFNFNEGAICIKIDSSLPTTTLS
jgi:hypothetical protein